MFLDEIDKVAGRESGGRGPDVSREGVQRDLLPIVEGTSVNTKYGFVKTDHVLFIAAGAFHVSKPSDLIPELQGRFPIRVELDSLTEEDFVRILTEPENALLKQYQALLGAEAVDLDFSEDAIREIARDAERVNRALENIGARRLHTIIERLLEEISFAGPENAGKAISIEVDDVRRPRRSREGRGPVAVRSVRPGVDESTSRESRIGRSRVARFPRRNSRDPILDSLRRSSALSLACGKKGDPQPPLPRGPRAISDLTIEQEGGRSRPDVLVSRPAADGAPLTDLESIEVYRVPNPPRADGAAAAPPAAPPGAEDRRGAGRGSAPAPRRRPSGRRRRLPTARRSRSSLSARRDRASARTARRSSTATAWAPARGRQARPPRSATPSSPCAAAGERSPLSNIATLAPGGPSRRARHPRDHARGGKDLHRVAGACDGPARPAREVGGYFVYRRALPEEEYEAPLNAKPVTGTTFVDAAAPYGASSSTRCARRFRTSPHRGPARG